MPGKLLTTVIAVATVLACASCGVDFNQAQGSDAGGGGGSGSGGGGGGSGDLPCDVQAVLSAHCTSCHGSPPTNQAPMSLVTYADLAATSTLGGTIAQRALIRVQSTTAPMPPAPATAVSAAELATFQAWVDAGLPAGSCGANDPLNAPPMCSSGRTWNGGDEGSSRMNPGQACIACHDASGGEAPRFTIAGTVYPTGHEPNNCDGASGAVSVVITDANNHVQTLSVNSAGNFYANASVAFPIQAKVVANGMERAMATPQTSGDCNACHTQNGTNMAPGRIVVP